MIIYAVVFALHWGLPARRVDGYINDVDADTSRKYYLNGLTVLAVVLSVWFIMGWFGWVQWSWLFDHRWWGLLGASVLGIGYSLVLVFTAPATGRSMLVDFFLGRAENVQYAGRVDAKMYLYLAGATLLVLNVLALALHHVQTFAGAYNPGVLLHAGLLLFFVLDYLSFERVHLYTYDIFAERLGFKLAWGCLVFYPFFYPIGLWSTVDMGVSPAVERWGVSWLLFSALVFFVGWGITRGANLQKYEFKRFPERAFLGWRPETLTEGNHTLLCNGFWGVARHVNYLGEMIMAIGLVLALGHLGSPWPWLYPLYYVVLLTLRERDDDRRCAMKYGRLWERYRERVPYRIIPYVY